MTENMANQLLCDAIIEYVKSDEQKYAVAIQGPWGCGKHGLWSLCWLLH